MPSFIDTALVVSRRCSTECPKCRTWPTISLP
jgi:hypothetical protein